MDVLPKVGARHASEEVLYAPWNDALDIRQPFPVDGSAPMANWKETAIAGIFSFQPVVYGRDRLERGAGRVACASVAVPRRQKPRDAQTLRESAAFTRLYQSFEKTPKAFAAHCIRDG